MYFTVDDIAIEHAGSLWKLEELKDIRPDFKVTVFVMAARVDDVVEEWLINNKNWVEVGVHGLDHSSPPECERENRGEIIKKSYEILKPLLPEKCGFRAPGFQMTASTYPILQDTGFWYIAHQSRIQPLRQVGEYNQEIIVNTHIYDNKLYEVGKLKTYEGKFRFISEGFNHNAC
jgi:hypothetical protein